MYQSYLIIGIFWVVYLGLHSLFATDTIKTWFKRRVPWVYKYYRLYYSFFSVFGMLLFTVYISLIESHPIWSNPTTTKYVGMVVAAWGVIIIKQSFKAYSLKEFLGLDEEQHEQLEIRGIQSKVRHPLYSGTILVIIGLFLYSPTYEILISMTVIFAYLVVGIRLEERKLIRTFGEAYLDYRNKVPMLIPNFFG